ncbi:hypothetical protein VTN00DRAFT_747 [Thermoascus crustaceus]|uniref:uncharacterized protein n=1 Tax=Thermoascus crustaceus TaxID=5088 RepID=UPI0037443CD1
MAKARVETASHLHFTTTASDLGSAHVPKSGSVSPWGILSAISRRSCLEGPWDVAVIVANGSHADSAGSG